MAITQRRTWLRALPVTHLAYAHHAAEVARTQFGDGLAPVDDVMPEAHYSDADIEARIRAINDRFDAERPKRLRVRVKSYSTDRISIAVSDAGSPARKNSGISTGEARPWSTSSTRLRRAYGRA